MTPLEQIVLPLAESRLLAEKGIVLETALQWVTNPYNKEPFVIPVWIPRADEETVLCPAPTLSELLDAIRGKVEDIDADFVIGRWKANKDDINWTVYWREGMAHELGATDLLAAYELLMEVTK